MYISVTSAESKMKSKTSKTAFEHQKYDHFSVCFLFADSYWASSDSAILAFTMHPLHNDCGEYKHPSNSLVSTADSKEITFHPAKSEGCSREGRK